MKAKSPDEYIITIKSWSLKDHKPLRNEKTNAKELVDLLTKPNLCGDKPVVKRYISGSSIPCAYLFMVDLNYNNYVNDYIYSITLIGNSINVYHRYDKICTNYIFSSEECANKFWEAYIENNSHLLKTLYVLRFKKEYFKNVDKVKNINGMTFKSRWEMYKYLGNKYGVDSKDGWVFGHGYTPLIRKQLNFPFDDPKNEYETCEVYFTHEDATTTITT